MEILVQILKPQTYCYDITMAYYCNTLAKVPAKYMCYKHSPNKYYENMSLLGGDKTGCEGIMRI